MNGAYHVPGVSPDAEKAAELKLAEPTPPTRSTWRSRKVGDEADRGRRVRRPRGLRGRADLGVLRRRQEGHPREARQVERSRQKEKERKEADKKGKKAA
jgi:hypothetical protein